VISSTSWSSFPIHILRSHVLVRPSLDLLQQDLDEPILLRTLAGKCAALLRVPHKVTLGLESADLDIWVALVVQKVEQVDEDGAESLCTVSQTYPNTLVTLY